MATLLSAYERGILPPVPLRCSFDYLSQLFTPIKDIIAEHGLSLRNLCVTAQVLMFADLLLKA